MYVARSHFQNRLNWQFKWFSTFEFEIVQFGSNFRWFSTFGPQTVLLKPLPALAMVNNQLRTISSNYQFLWIDSSIWDLPVHNLVDLKPKLTINQQLMSYKAGQELWAEIMYYPPLSRIAVDILFIPPMSGEPERLFSSAKNIIDDSRNCLQVTTVEALDCMKSWFKCG